jgi:hypothetical protein
MSIDATKVSLKDQLKLFCTGILVGCISGILWQELLSPIHITPNMTVTEEYNILKSDAEDRLLKYIEGRWQSSIGDVVINISDGAVSGNFIVIENIYPNPKKEEKYKITNIVKVDGLLGLVALEVCNVNTNCTLEDRLLVQVNKVFGIDKTITLTYDTRLTYCVPIDNHCTRAFKEIDK